MKTFSKLLIAILVAGFSGIILTSCDNGSRLVAPSGSNSQVSLQLVFPEQPESAGLKKANAINEVTVSVVDLETIDLLAGELSNKPAVLINEQALTITQSPQGRFAEGILDIPLTDETQRFQIIVFASDIENQLFLSGRSEIELEQGQSDEPTVTVLMGQAVSITSFGTSSASSTFTSGDFGAGNGNDLDFGTSWFSAGPAADPEGSVYTWTISEPQFIGTMGVFNNSEHDNSQYRSGFGFEKVNYKIYSGPGATGDLLFDETIDYPNTAAVPVLRVSPFVIGQSVELTLTGHESEICGGFSELLIVNPLIRGPELQNIVSVNSIPPGATIYLDGGNMDLTTPAILTDVQPGSHTVRLYLPGFNEHSENFVLTDGGTPSVSVNLSQPGSPMPVITISQPTDGATFNDNVITISGSIQLRAANGTLSPFTGNNAIFTLNGVDQDIAVSNGSFTESASIASGQNTISLRANSPNGDTGVSDVATITGEFVAPDIEVTLTWNTAADLDLHVWNPNGEHAYYSNTSIADGSLDIDDTNGFGPETFTVPTALAGSYIVKVNSFSLGSDGSSDATIQLQLNGGQKQTFGPHRFTVDDSNGTNPEAWWDVTTFAMSGGLQQVKVTPVSSEIAQKIIRDMQNLKTK